MRKGRIFAVDRAAAVVLFIVSFFYGSLSQNDEFFYNGFNGGGSTKPTLTLNGMAERMNEGIIQLTNVTSRLIGRAFHPQPLRFRSSGGGAASAFSFSTAFAFSIVPEYPSLGGHGLAFVVSTSPELGGLPSQYLGLLNASDIGNATNHLFAVEFDTVQDFEFADINDNHVGIDLNNMVSNASAAVSYLDANHTKVNLTLKSGAVVQAWVDYDGAAKILYVSIAPLSEKPALPLLSFPVDLSPLFHDFMYVGFSASTGLLSSSHYLLGWSFNMSGVAKSLNLSALPALPVPPGRHVSSIVVAFVVSSAVILAAALFAGCFVYKVKNADVIESWELECGPHRFSYKELKKATRGFREKELLGFGGFGKVYKGILPSSGVAVAVKRVSHESRQGIREFVAEIASIGRLRHRNLVQLQGWCRRRADLLLVYDYMPNGSLDKFIFCDYGGGAHHPPLTWKQRLRILRGVASALVYLHEEWEHVVVHRDVKSSNILLDGELNGRLGDFGLAKLYEHGANPSTTRVVGTLGYLAPELTRTGKATVAADVFAFGAVILEVVCGRRPVDPKAAAAEELVLVDWVWNRWSSGRWEEAVDPRLDGFFDGEEVKAALKVGLLCSHPTAAARPTMREVARYLDGGGELPELTEQPAEEEYYRDEGMVGFEDFVHSYPSSSFEKVSPASAPATSAIVDVGLEESAEHAATMASAAASMAFISRVTV